MYKVDKLHSSYAIFLNT